MARRYPDALPAERLERWKNPDNPRLAMLPRKFESLQRSLAEFGLVQPIVVNKRRTAKGWPAGSTPTVVGGHKRIDAALALGLEDELEIKWVDITPRREQALNLVLNELDSPFDERAVDAILQTFELEGEDPLLAGFDPDEVAALHERLHRSAGRSRGPGLLDRFTLPPFSVLDSRMGYWRDRKRAWLSLGIVGETRSPEAADWMDAQRGLTIKSDSGRDPSFYAQKRAVEARLGRELTTAEFERDYYVNRQTAGSFSETGTSVFDPVLCELAYRWFSPPGGRVLDPFAGGIVRGLVASRLGRSYTGIELRHEQLEANESQWEEISGRAPERPVEPPPSPTSEDFAEPPKPTPASELVRVDERERRDGPRGRVLLVVPPYLTVDRLTAQLYPLPYAAAMLAAVLREDGFEVEIKDFLLPAEPHKTKRPETFAKRAGPPYLAWGATFPAVRKWLRRELKRFDAVGLCAGQCNVWEGGVVVAEEVHRAKLPLVVGGPFVTTAPEAAAELFEPAISVLGEGEAVVVEAFERAIKGSRGEIRGRPVDISGLPLPAWDLVDLSKYPKVNGRRRGVLTISRGCPWSCAFCSVFTIMDRAHRRLSREEIEAQLLHLWKLGVRYFCFLDDNLVINRSAWEDLSGAIVDLRHALPDFDRARFYMEEGMEIRVAAEPGIVEEMAALGFENIALGLETANDRQAKAQRKPYKPEQVEAAIGNCHAAGIVPKAFYIVGLPGDSVASVCEDLVEFARLGVAVRPNNLKLYPGTAMTRYFLEHGWIDDAYDWRLSGHWTPDTPWLSYAEIKRLKAVLGAIGFGAETFRLDLFGDSAEGSVEKINETKGYSATLEDGRLVIEGNMYRETPFRHLATLLLLQDGAPGVAIKIEKTKSRGVLEATELSAPADEIQAALGAAIRKEAAPITKTALAITDEEPTPVWIEGDSRELPALLGPERDFDLLFSCPPYYDLEVYSPDGRDLSNMSWEDFLSAYREIIAASVDRLAADRFAVWVVTEVRDRQGIYRGLVSETRRAFEDAGARFYNDAVYVTAAGSWPVRVGKQFSAGRKLARVHQNVLVFVKGEGRAAATACGEIEAASLEELVAQLTGPGEELEPFSSS